uniref:Uncharacterized protein n=1 Tax=Caenorhabditis japonica TaxID=281687 RepID=A0A8R1DLD4_CAEJA
MMCSSIRGNDFGLRDYPVCPGLWDVSKPATSKLGRFEALMLHASPVFQCATKISNHGLIIQDDTIILIQKPGLLKLQFNEKLDNCVSVCADDHIKLIPAIKKRFTKNI